MFKSFRDKIALSGVTVLLIGVALLVFTFISAYGFLTQSLSIITSDDLVQTFGEALAPLIATCIRIMYLGVMGWVGSLLTIRGVTIIAHAPQTAAPQIQKSVEVKQQPQPQLQKAKVEKPQKETKKTENKPTETKPSEPEFVVIPPETVSESSAEEKQNSHEKAETPQAQAPQQSSP